MNKVCISIPNSPPGKNLKLKVSGLYSSLLVILFTLISQKDLVVGGQKCALFYP